MEDLVVYFNGNYQTASKMSVPIDNLGFTRGYAAYECFRTYNRVPFRLNDHIKRLKNTCEELLINFPKEDLFHITETLIAKNKGSDLVFRIYVTDDIAGRPYQLIILCNSPSWFENTHPSKPLRLKTVIDTRENTSIKSTSYSKAMVEIKKAKKVGFDDILFVGEDNIIHEVSRANIFCVKDSTLYTPKNDFLPGITRLTILEIAHEYGYRVKVDNIHLDFLKEVEEVFISSSIRGITKVSKVNDITFSAFDQTDKLQSFFINLRNTACLA